MGVQEGKQLLRLIFYHHQRQVGNLLRNTILTALALSLPSVLVFHHLLPKKESSAKPLVVIEHLERNPHILLDNSKLADTLYSYLFESDPLIRVTFIAILLISISLIGMLAWQCWSHNLKERAIIYTLGLNQQKIIFLEVIDIYLRTFIAAPLAVLISNICWIYFYDSIASWWNQLNLELFIFYLLLGLLPQYLLLPIFYAVKPFKGSWYLRG